MAVLPEAIDKLVELFEVGFRLEYPNTQVLDGPEIDDIGTDVVAVGLNAEDLATTATVSFAGMEARQERLDINCLIRSWTGDPDLAERRRVAFAMFDLAREIVRTNHTLGGVVTHAYLAGYSYLPSRLPEGAVATIAFSIRIDALTG